MKIFIIFAFLIICSCSVERKPHNFYYEKYSIHATNFYMNNMKKNKKLWIEYQKAEQKIIDNNIKESKYVNNTRKFNN